MGMGHGKQRIFFYVCMCLKSKDIKNLKFFINDRSFQVCEWQNRMWVVFIKERKFGPA